MISFEKWKKTKSIDHRVGWWNIQGITTTNKSRNFTKFKRIFTDWIEGQGYDLLIGRENGKKSKVIWRINKSDNLNSELKITIHPHDISRYPGIVKSFLYIFYGSLISSRTQ